MPDFRAIYQRQGSDYDLMVSREDYQGNLLPALQAICSLDGADVVELGAGTGRLTALIAPLARSLRALDASEHMLGVLRQKLPQANALAADNRALPLAAGVADVTVAGWSLGHSVGWYPDDWQAQIQRAITEMLRLLRSGGTAIILETLGTGSETPAPPTEGLAAYYDVLENDLSFKSTWLRTDYRFQSPAEGQARLRFFFGDALADRVIAEQLTILPECTGIWWRTLE